MTIRIHHKGNTEAASKALPLRQLKISMNRRPNTSTPSSKMVLTATLAIAGMVLAPVAAQAAGLARQPRLNFSDSVPPHQLRSPLPTQQRAGRSLKTVTQNIDVYLAPKNTMTDAGFRVIDSKHGIGRQVVLSSSDAAGGQVFNVQANGEIQLATKVGGQTLCLDVFGANYANETAVDVWPCNGGGNQKWHLSTGNDSFYALRPAAQPKASDFCLDVYESGVDSGTPVQIYACNSSENQQWTFISAG